MGATGALCGSPADCDLLPHFAANSEFAKVALTLPPLLFGLFLITIGLSLSAASYNDDVLGLGTMVGTGLDETPLLALFANALLGCVGY
jgi:hypothetical protein